jgi:hypothetical protein
VSRRQIDNSRVHQYPWVEDRQTIQVVLTDIVELLYCLSVLYSRVLMNSCIVCLSSTHRYWWSLVLSVCLLLKDIDELLYCLSVFYSRILMNSCIVCLSSTHWYWWTLVLSVRLLLTDIDELLYCLSVFYSRILMKSLVSLCLLLTDIDELVGVCPSSTHWYWWTLVLSVRLLLTGIDYLFGVFRDPPFVNLFTLSSHNDIYFIYDSKFWILILYIYWTKLMANPLNPFNDYVQSHMKY